MERRLANTHIAHSSCLWLEQAHEQTNEQTILRMQHKVCTIAYLVLRLGNIHTKTANLNFKQYSKMIVDFKFRVFFSISPLYQVFAYKIN